jgi:hypothetical protein
MHNPTRAELRDEQRYLEGQLGAGNIGRYEAARQRALADAYTLVKRRYRGEYLSLSDYGLRAALESRNADGWCEAGSIHESGPLRRWWLVRWNVVTGARVLRRMG